MERVRVALGGEPLNYLGYSYGTALGVAYLEAHPDRVRTMVLDGALDPTLTWDALLTEQSRGFDAALSRAAGRLRAHPLRLPPRGVGRPRGRLRRASPPGSSRPRCRPGTARHGRAGRAHPRRGRGAVRPAQRLAGRGGRAGRRAAAATAGRCSRCPTPTSAAPPAATTRSTEANLAVSCVDRPWPRSPQAYVDLAGAGSPRRAPRFGPGERAVPACPAPPGRSLPTAAPHPVRAPARRRSSSLGTTRDPATPYAWAVALAAQLPQGVLLTHDGEGHTAYRAGAAGLRGRPGRTTTSSRRRPRPASRC